MTHTTYSMTVLLVDDIGISKTFYQTLFNFEIKHDFGENIVFKNGFSIWQKKRAHQIIFGEKRDSLNFEKSTELYFETSQIEKMWSRIISDKNIDIIHEIKEEQWGQRTLRIFDPDKFIIEIAEPMDHVVKRLAQSNCSIEAIAQKTQVSMKEVKQILYQE